MRIVRTIMRKLISRRGETLTETLSSLLIIVPAMVMLAGAIVAAARINNEARISKASSLPKYSSPYTTQDNSHTITGSEGSDLFISAGITWYQESGSVYYYFR